MEPAAYQGLFYLSSGVACFTLLFLGFRLLSDRMTQTVGSDKKAAENVWRGKEWLEVVEILRESRDIKTFRLRRPLGDFPPFNPGQFLSFQIGDDATCLRSYSIASSATSCKTVQVSIKRLDDGLGSGWFHNLATGSKVLTHPPAGLFTDAQSGDGERVFVAGGIGITPIMSMIQTNLESARNCRMTLFYGMRTEADLAFHELLQYLAERHSHFSYFPVLSEPGDKWEGDQGFITHAYIKKNRMQQDSALYFLCGPDVMTENLIAELVECGVPSDNIHLEKFASPASFDRSSLSDKSLAVRYGDQMLAYNGKRTVLEFLEDNALFHPFACRVGVCGSCKCKITGKVEVITDAGLTRAEKREGLILPCVAFPQEDIEIQVG